MIMLAVVGESRGRNLHANPAHEWKVWSTSGGHNIIDCVIEHGNRTWIDLSWSAYL